MQLELVTGVHHLQLHANDAMSDTPSCKKLYTFLSLSFSFTGNGLISNLIIVISSLSMSTAIEIQNKV